jgi:hypothetical protein
MNTLRHDSEVGSLGRAVFGSGTLNDRHQKKIDVSTDP